MNKLLRLWLVSGLIAIGCNTATGLPPTSPAPTATSIITPTTLPTATYSPPTATLTPAPETIIATEMQGAFDFFWEQANTDTESSGYGLVRDRYPGSPGVASIAAVGFALSAYPIGVEKGYITQAQGLERVTRTFKTLANMERTEGFYYHFVDLQTGQRVWDSEVSSIDTAILMMGVLTAGEYFSGETQIKANELYADVNWPWFVDETRQMFYMAYRPEKGFEGYWDFYAEQLMLYVLAAGSPTHPTTDKPYYTFIRHTAKYGTGEPFIHSWFGSIFTYQFSHAWIDFREYRDQAGVNWFENSAQAIQAQYEFAVNLDAKYLTLGPSAWGLSASDGPQGYNGLAGAPPSGYDNSAHKIDDTIAPYAAIASILFMPEQALEAMLNYYSLEPLHSVYGLKDAYNLSKNWYASDVIGIDKGITLLMLANYENDTIYAITMRNTQLLNGLERLRLTHEP